MVVILMNLYRILNYLLYLYSLLIVIDAIMSWVPAVRESVLGRFIGKLVEPYFDLFRRGPLVTLSYNTGIDISPLIGLLIIYFIQKVVLVELFKLLIFGF
ncbi:YggT family protein [Lactobacillus psittaci]|uniref:YggT family protein n=1 Tax=Lactobacillus psittaci TaxID=116089 RepID=UPI00040C20EC|nr:YggT family protein [Lactobacillus psittaci]